jgi:16S rRNA (cytidine1402-2'-O)-methyltransferase
MPLIADPGYDLVAEAAARGLPVTAAPGPSAALTALVLSGLPADRFLFAGFLPAKSAERRTRIGELAGCPATLVLYESPKRVRELFGDLVQIAGEERRAAVCRELTKRFEEVRRGTLGELRDWLGSVEPRGEYVVVVDRGAAVAAGLDVEAELQRLMVSMGLRDAAAAVAAATGLPRREVYRRGLKLGGRE